MRRKDWLGLGQGLALGRGQEWGGGCVDHDDEDMFQEQGKCIVFTSAYDFLKYKVRAFTHCSERQERIYNVIRSEKIYFIH